MTQDRYGSGVALAQDDSQYWQQRYNAAMNRISALEYQISRLELALELKKSLNTKEPFVNVSMFRKKKEPKSDIETTEEWASEQPPEDI